METTRALSEEEISSILEAEFEIAGDNPQLTLQEKLNELYPTITEVRGALQQANIDPGMVSLIIEGGIGFGYKGFIISQLAFPNAAFLGFDINRHAGPFLYNERFSTEGANAGRYKKYLLALRDRLIKPNCGVKDKIPRLRANCFDYPLIRDIQSLMPDGGIVGLVGYNALYALLADKMNVWDRKSSYDRKSISEILERECPYGFMLFISSEPPWDPNIDPVIRSPYERMEKAAREREGWQTFRTEHSLLLVNQNYIRQV